MNLLGCLVRLFAWMPSWVSLGARSWSTGESTPSAPPLAERERRRRVREKTPQPSPTSPSAAALVRRGRNVRFASTDASAPPGSPPYEGGRERVRGGGGVTFLAVAWLPIRVFRRCPCPNRPRRPHHRRRGSPDGCREQRECVVVQMGKCGVVGPTGVGDEMGTR
jgi:hypothetical protein